MGSAKISKRSQKNSSLPKGKISANISKSHSDISNVSAKTSTKTKKSKKIPPNDKMTSSTDKTTSNNKIKSSNEKIKSYDNKAITSKISVSKKSHNHKSQKAPKKKDLDHKKFKKTSYSLKTTNKSSKTGNSKGSVETNDSLIDISSLKPDSSSPTLSSESVSNTEKQQAVK